MDKTAFELLALGSAIENFLVFLASGFLIISIGGVFIDFHSDLPEWYISLIQEPISIKFFFGLCMFSLIGTAIATKGGVVNRNNSVMFKMLLLAPGRAGICCGAIISGMLFGIGSGLLAHSAIGRYEDLLNTSFLFITLGIFCVSVVYPISVLMLYMVNDKQKHNWIIDLLGVVYVLVIIYASYKLSIKIDWVGIGLCFSFLLAFRYIYFKYIRKADNNSLHSHH